MGSSSSIPGSSAPVVEPYVPDEQIMEDMWEAAASGNEMQVLNLYFTSEAGSSAYEIEARAERAEWFGPLESAADSLTIDLNAVTDDRKIELTDWQAKFLKEAVLQMESKSPPEPPSKHAQSAIDKLSRGEKLNEEEAKSLYSFLTDAKELVIPTEQRRQTSGPEMEREQKRFEEQLSKAENTYHDYSPRS